jgi:succinate-acetate transporter protein
MPSESKSFDSIAALRKNVGFITLFLFLTITFALLAGGELAGSVSYVRLSYVLSSISNLSICRSTKAGGVVGVITAFVAYYVGLSELLTAEDMAVVRLPLGIFPKRVD